MARITRAGLGEGKGQTKTKRRRTTYLAEREVRRHTWQRGRQDDIPGREREEGKWTDQGEAGGQEEGTDGYHELGEVGSWEGDVDD